MATIRDVARESGFSVTTASRALNNHGDVAAVTRARVEEVARALDYHPNAAARTLQCSRTDTVGLVIPVIRHRAHNAFWQEFIGGFTAACAGQGIDVLLSVADECDDGGQGLRRLVQGRRVDGVLVCDIRLADPRLPYLRKGHLPFLAFGRTLGTPDYPYIDVDGTTGVRKAVEHLIHLGHRRIAYFGLEQEFGFAHHRFEGYRTALERAGLALDPALVHHGLGERDVPGVLSRLLDHPDSVTAIFGAADFLALAALAAARGMGVGVPDRLSIVAFDDSLLVQHADPPLTAVGQSNDHLGEEAAVLLLDRITNPAGAPVQRLIVPTLTPRHSTAALSAP